MRDLIELYYCWGSEIKGGSGTQEEDQLCDCSREVVKVLAKLVNDQTEIHPLLEASVRRELWVPLILGLCSDWRESSASLAQSCLWNATEVPW